MANGRTSGHGLADHVGKEANFYEVAKPVVGITKTEDIAALFSTSYNFGDWQ